ncbi:hypothetical protein TWF569_003553 [Orbilia oligospora]|nr:hypothetical protein TWF569_003553 [Orbilia oligospora]
MQRRILLDFIGVNAATAQPSRWELGSYRRFSWDPSIQLLYVSWCRLVRHLVQLNGIFKLSYQIIKKTDLFRTDALLLSLVGLVGETFSPTSLFDFKTRRQWSIFCL